jgi:UDP:flavonoid glycosyltransferase YjiC (YdhE family)
MNDGSRSLTVLFLPESAYGPTNQRIGLGDVLARRGHQVVFAAESSWRAGGSRWASKSSSSTSPSRRSEQDAGAFWTEFIRETAPIFRRHTIEQLDASCDPPGRP